MPGIGQQCHRPGIEAAADLHRDERPVQRRAYTERTLGAMMVMMVMAVAGMVMRAMMRVVVIVVVRVRHASGIAWAGRVL
jgi:hypothetical protein